jgi:hypothetical protein
MSKLYVFGIGGTGSRVIKALTMLLASGVKCDVDTIVPIIIDPDSSSADKDKTVGVLRKYMSIHDQIEIYDSEDMFFKTNINKVLPNYQLPVDNTNDIRFEEYIGFSTMGEPNKALMKMLFSDKNLSMDMKVGFKGNPNVGCIVLNQFVESEGFNVFAQSFQEGDRIFIISSIFGGTGASGFPLLVKILRGLGTDQMENHAIINNSIIGAITVMPYFGVRTDDGSEISSSTFISKTKAALSYYDRNISSNNSVDMLYYLGDEILNSYENCEGGKSQKNEAHLIEMISALAIIDFSSSATSRNRTTIHKEFGVETRGGELVFNNFGTKTKKNIEKPLTQMYFFSQYLKNECKKEYNHQPWAIDRKIKGPFFKSTFYNTLAEFQDSFIEWLNEMDKNGRSFTPYRLGENNDILNSVKGCPPCPPISNFQRSFLSDYARLDNYLNKQKRKKTKNNDFVELFFLATNDLFNKYLKVQ